jgi:acyl carrier protein
MRMKDIVFQTIRNLLCEILDIDENAVRPDTYLMRDLAAESIDLLELAVALNTRFDVDVDDEALFLTPLRDLISEARKRGMAPVDHVSEALPFLAPERIQAILADLAGGPVLQVADLEAYIRWRLGETE